MRRSSFRRTGAGAVAVPHGPPVRGAGERAHERVEYEPAESHTGLFGGNSNWRGPVWFPVNYLLIEVAAEVSLLLRGRFQVECPTCSGQEMDLWEVASEISKRLTRIFLRGEDGRRPVRGRGRFIQQGSALA